MLDSRENLAYRALSFWHDTSPDKLEARPALEADIDADIAIVGAGYTGLWTAYYLKKSDPSLDIVVLESEIAGFGASGRNGGWCSAYLSGIEYWLDKPNFRDDGIRLQRLMFDTVQEVGRVTELEGIDCHFEQAGTLEIAVNDAQFSRLREELAYWRELGFKESDHRWLDSAELRETLAVDKALAAIHMPHTAAVHPARLVRGLAATVEKMGVSIHEQSPVNHLAAGRVETGRGSIKAETVLMATEGYSDSLPAFQRRMIPVHSMMVITEPLSDEQLALTRFKRRYTFSNLDRMVTYGQLTADRRIAFGCRGTYHFGSGIRTFGSDDPEFPLIRETLLRFFPGLDGIRFTHAWGGTMGVSRNLRPAVNFDPKSRLGWAAGFFGNGVGATHLAGRTLADLVLERDTERVRTPWVNPFPTARKWEPEPVRWLGFTARRLMMQIADWRDYLK